MVWIYTLLGVLGVIGLWLAVVATIALHRTEDLDRAQKIGQGIIVWLVPIIGALFVLHLLQNHDQDAIPEKWVPNDTINHYVRDLLGFEARATNRFAKGTIEHEVVETVIETFRESSEVDASD